MARSYAQLMTAIWRDKSFLALSANARFTYIALVSQADISAAGVLAYRPARWVPHVTDGDPRVLHRAITELAARKFIVLDIDTAELFVRSFVRWDRGYTNSKRRPVIRDAAGEVVSPAVREAMIHEFQRLNLPAEWVAACREHDADGAAGVPDDTENVFPLFTDSELGKPQVEGVSGTASDAVSASGRVVGTDLSSREPQPTTRNPQPEAPSAPDDGRPTVNQRVNTLARSYCDVVKLSNYHGVAGIVRKAIATGQYSDQQIQAALDVLAGEDRSVTAESLRHALHGPPRMNRYRATTGDRITEYLQRTGTADDHIAAAFAPRSLPRGRTT